MTDLSALFGEPHISMTLSGPNTATIESSRGEACARGPSALSFPAKAVDSRSPCSCSEFRVREIPDCMLKREDADARHCTPCCRAKNLTLLLHIFIFPVTATNALATLLPARRPWAFSDPPTIDDTHPFNMRRAVMIIFRHYYHAAAHSTVSFAPPSHETYSAVTLKCVIQSYIHP